MEDMNICNSGDAKPEQLVSVVVITYNSSQTVVETLDSIKTQTYQNIELIVSDDCSSDNTVEVVQNWIDENYSRFYDVQLVTTGNNTGVAGNINRGIAHSHGEWIKSIAGDDLLIPSAIETYMSFVMDHFENVRICVCDVECFSTDGEVKPSTRDAYKSFFEKECESYEMQKKRVMTELVFVGPTYFYSRELFNELGGYPEKYGCAEEWPFVYKIIRSGNRIFAINKKLVRYRIQYESSLCHSSDHGMTNKRHFIGMYQHYFDHPFKDLIREGSLLTAWHYALSYWAIRLQYRIKSDKIRGMTYFFIMLLSPLNLWRMLNRLILKI